MVVYNEENINSEDDIIAIINFNDLNKIKEIFKYINVNKLNCFKNVLFYLIKKNIHMIILNISLNNINYSNIKSNNNNNLIT